MPEGLQRILPPSDMRRRGDVRLLEQGQYDAAEAERKRLLKRVASARAAATRPHEPRWFQLHPEVRHAYHAMHTSACASWQSTHLSFSSAGRHTLLHGATPSNMSGRCEDTDAASSTVQYHQKRRLRRDCLCILACSTVCACCLKITDENIQHYDSSDWDMQTCVLLQRGCAAQKAHFL